jgi:hypothetical protein
MAKVEGSNPFIRFVEQPAGRAISLALVRLQSHRIQRKHIVSRAVSPERYREDAAPPERR